MKIKDLPSSSRPRERFLNHGKEALSEAELLSIILRTGTKKENVIEMSNRLISEYKLEELFDCTLTELQKINGIGQAKAMQILAISELGKRYNKAKNPITKINSSEDVFNYFHDKLKNEKQECFYTLMLNTKNSIIKEKLISKGVLDAAIIHPREVFKPAIKNSSAKIILIHNHPSGNPEPSNEDLEITEKIIKLGDEMDIKVLDHVIIGKETWWSWTAEN